jgi:hypothetical protein
MLHGSFGLLAAGEHDPQRDDPFPPLLRPNLQPFFLVQPIEQAVVDLPSLPPPQHVQSPLAVAHPDRREFPKTQPDGSRIPPATPIPICPPVKPFDLACLSFANLVRSDQMPGEPAPGRRLQTFFDSMSCNIFLSSLRSATIPFSLRFSSSNAAAGEARRSPSPCTSSNGRTIARIRPSSGIPP